MGEGKGTGNHSVTLKVAYITAGGAIIAALITGIISIFGETESTAKAPIAQTINGNGVGVINTGSGNVNVQRKD